MQLTVGFLFVSAPILSAVTLYDGSAGNLPSDQALQYVTNPFFGAAATQQQLGNGVRLDTTAATSDQAGYFGFHPATPVMDRTVGFTVSFDVRLISESHANNNRAGLSVIALGSDNKGVEIGFWTDKVWAQSDSPLFEQAEGAAFDTSSALLRYDLTISGSTYSLMQGATTILSGAVRDYSAFGLPYTQQNFVFVGDDTSSANGVFDFGYLAVTPVPEPATVVMLLVGGALLGSAAWKKRRVTR